MIYKSFQNLKLSALGMGCMRLPHKDDYNDIDIPATKTGSNPAPLEMKG